MSESRAGQLTYVGQSQGPPFGANGSGQMITWHNCQFTIQRDNNEIKWKGDMSMGMSST